MTAASIAEARTIVRLARAGFRKGGHVFNYVVTYEIEKGIRQAKADLARAQKEGREAEIRNRQAWPELAAYNKTESDNMKPEHTRPFNAADARAGAPYCCRDGEEATVLKWDARHEDFPLVGVSGNVDTPRSWTSEGLHVCGSKNEPKDLVMTPLGEIAGKPVFVGDKIAGHGLPITVTPKMCDFTGFTWPAPARQYPVTGMSRDEMAVAIRTAPLVIHSASIETGYRIANTALRHAIDADTVRITEEVKAREKRIIDEAYTEGFRQSRKSEAYFLTDEARAELLAKLKG